MRALLLHDSPVTSTSHFMVAAFMSFVRHDLLDVPGAMVVALGLKAVTGSGTLVKRLVKSLTLGVIPFANQPKHQGGALSRVP